MANLPPLSLYIHIPWCVQKCPYCDFNSHALKGEVPHDDYVQHLLNDLQADAHYAQGREIGTILFYRWRGAAGRQPDEITDPGVEAKSFVDYQRAEPPSAYKCKLQRLLDGVRAST